jgi:hypothetical protein
MSQSPKRPYSLAEAHGRLRIWGSDGEDGKQTQNGGQPGGAAGDGSGDGGDGEQETPEQKRIRELEEKNAELDNKHKTEKQRADKAEKTLTDKEREGMEDAQRIEAERDDYKTKYEKLLKVVETSVIDSAIQNLSSAKDKNGQPKYNWQDVEAVRAFLKRDDISLDLDTGEVTGLDGQLKDIASKRPYLLVSKQEQDEQNGNQPPPPPGGPATGSHPTGGSTRQRETDRNKLGGKYKLPGFVGAGNVGARPI